MGWLVWERADVEGGRFWEGFCMCMMNGWLLIVPWELRGECN